MSESAPTSTLGTWLGLGASLWCGFLAWLPPLVTFWFLMMLSGRERWIGGGEMVAGTVLVALLTMGVPLGLLAWRRWRRAAIAYGAGIAIGAVPTAGLVAWFFLLAAAR